MSAHHNLSFPSQQSLSDYSHRPHLQPPTHDQYNNPDELKASYDDLIDQYSSDPYRTQCTPQHSDDEHDTTQIVYPPQPLAKQPDAPGFWQRILPDSMACRLYVLAVLVETTINLAIEGDLYLRIREVSEDQSNTLATRRMPVYLGVFALAHVFQFVMAVDAVYARNTLQFIFLTLFNGLLIIYAAIQIGEIRAALGPDNPDITVISKIPIDVLTTTIPIVLSVAELVYIGLGWKIYHEFGWKVYKFLGADRNIKRMYASYQIYECLVKFDVFFWAGFSVQFIWLVLQDNDWEYYVTCAALPLSIVLLVEGHLAARHENKWMMATFMSGCVGAMIYFIYKVSLSLLQICARVNVICAAHPSVDEYKHGYIPTDMEIAHGVFRDRYHPLDHDNGVLRDSAAEFRQGSKGSTRKKAACTIGSYKPWSCAEYKPQSHEHILESSFLLFSDLASHDLLSA
ncbi:hypothetical protein NP233_g5358 [Leucocoprinus birnbaumii]|uniref:Uncharacterized protein n=1 Tax=Leucocoprinus birnbaumii TaxID=56174 RepID=A0AAD5VT10_9AGAR|nr:hypothetical protein NP233_g5358 [Leucocoprinus birnbaumii]